jgi:hypothetical protein
VPLFYDAVLHRWCDQKPNRQNQKYQTGADDRTRQRRQGAEHLLKNSVELKTEKNLGAQNQEAIVAEGCLNLSGKLHRAKGLTNACRCSSTGSEGRDLVSFFKELAT